MEFICRFLGLVAGWNEGMSRQRINLIPFNWIATFALCAFFLFSLSSMQDGVTMNHAPIKTSIHDLMTNPKLKNKYVTVSGELEPDFAYQYGKKRSDGSLDADDTWMLLLDTKSVSGFFVQVPNEYFDDKKARTVTLTGTWGTVSSNLAPKLQEENFRKDGLTVDENNMLDAGAAPPEPAIWTFWAILSGVLALAFIITFFQRYVIFRAQPASAFSLHETSPANLPSLVRVTGEFALEMRDRKRFLNVPTHPTTLENGLFALLSNIDASSRFFGVKTNNRSGVWLVAITPSSVRDIKRGSFYIGGGSAPAIQFRYEDGVNSSTQTAILSFSNIQEREAVLAELTKMSGAAASVS